MEWDGFNDRRWISNRERHRSDFIQSISKKWVDHCHQCRFIFGTLGVGHPKSPMRFGCWPVTPFPLLLRVRSMAEHAGMETNSALTNTRAY